MKPYHLMSSLHGHTTDVKSLCITNESGGFASVSRDITCKVWEFASTQYVQSKVFEKIHTKYVNAVAVAYTLSEFPKGLILTGSNDQTIAIVCLETSEVVAQLKEHDGAVCNLYFDNNSNSNLLYSGSFDSTAKVWDLSNLKKGSFELNSSLKSSLTIKGHEQTVWSVLGIERQRVLLTGSADKTIKHWQLAPANKSSSLIVKYTGHTDCVRGLAMSNVNEQEFFSCSNDGTVIQWRLAQPTPLRTFAITSSFLYSINMVYTDDSKDNECLFVTSGEDRTLRIHSTANLDASGCIQKLTLPCQTLWYTICLPNKTIVVACSDGSIRLFTQNESLMANKSEQEEYEQELAGFAIPLKADEAMSQIDRNKLEDSSALVIPGSKDGQTLLINNENQIEVYQWSGADKKWVKIGVAVGSSSGAGGSAARQKTSYLGKEYDYVFDIDFDDQPGGKLKLPYNLSEDPYFAAQTFIHKHELSQTFLDEIAQFIMKNTQGETIVSTNTSTYCDPFTGAGRYIPSGYNNPPPRQTSAMVDPFTGSNAYYADNKSAPQSKVASTPSNEYFPHLEFILFDQTNFESIIKKLAELQKTILKNSGNDLITDPTNIELIEGLLNNYNTNSEFSNRFSDEIDLIFQMIDMWPIDSVFPLLDLLRILSLNKSIAIYLTRDQNANNFSNKQGQHASNYYFDILLRFLNDDKIVNSMLVIKIFCNLFKSLSDIKAPQVQKLLAYLLYERSYIIHRLNSFLGCENKSFQIAYSTLQLNYVVLVEKLLNYGEKFSDSVLTQLNSELIEYFNTPELNEHILNMDSEAIFRLLVSIGTLLAKINEQKDSDFLKAMFKSLENGAVTIEKIIQKASKYPTKVQQCASCILEIFN